MLNLFCICIFCLHIYNPDESKLCNYIHESPDSLQDQPPLMQMYADRFPGVFNEVQPDSVLIWFDKDSMKVGSILYGIIGGFILSEALCYLSVFMILKILRQNAASFTKKTYALHRQLTILLFLQVNLFNFLFKIYA